MRILWTLVVVVLAVGARPARPCTFALPGLDDAVFPFEGQLVPQNGVLRMLGFTTDQPIRFIHVDDDSEVAGTVDRDDVSSRLIPETPLTPGAWRVVVPPIDPASLEPPREVAFTMSADEDTDAPPPPTASASNHLRGTLFPGDSCQSSLHDVVLIHVEVDDPTLAAVAIASGRSEALDDGNAFLTLSSRDGGTQAFDVFVRDLADNESEPSRVEVWTGCAGACASGDPALPVALVGLAFLRRRRSAR